MVFLLLMNTAGYLGATVQMPWPRPQQPHPAVVRIIAEEERSTSMGSGTLVAVDQNYGWVLTNWHVVRDATGEIRVLFPGGFHGAARVVKTDRDWDLAALLIERPPVDPVPLAAAAPRPGEVLTIAGYGSGTYRAISGRCTQYVAPAMHMPYEMVEVSVEARQGDSGGPIFNSQGELAGVLFGSGFGTTSGSYTGRVRWFLASIHPEAIPRDPSALAQRPRSPSAFPSLPVAPPSGSTATAASREEPASRVVAIPQRQAQQSTWQSSRPEGQPPWSKASDQHSSAKINSSEAASDVAVVTLEDLIGHSSLEKVKTLLALVGLLAIFVRFSRMESGGR